MLRVIVKGDNDTAKAVRGMLLRGGFVVTSAFARLELTILEADVNEPVLDGVDGDLERYLLAAIADQTPSGRVLIQRKDGNRSDQVMRITVPAHDDERAAMETAVLRALHAYVTGVTPRAWGLRFGRRAR